jgi:RND family efflux transporter MFP subunit
VRYTEVKQTDVRRTIKLPGTVRSATLSVVASEVEGLVVRYPAREGDAVAKGKPLAILRTEMLELQRDATAEQLAEAEARLTLAQINLERTRGLFEKQVASQQDLDNALSEHTAWQARTGDLKARLAQIELAIRMSTIRAPFAGLVVSERTEVGQWLTVGGPVVELMSLDDLEVYVEVPERYYPSLHSGAKAQVTVDAIQGLTIDGIITAIIARADPEARTFPVKVKIANAGGRIGAGMLAQVAFPAGESYRATVVPKDAIVRQGEASVVYRINGEDKVDVVPVTTGEGVGAWIVVSGEIATGQKVITRGNERVFPGMVVKGDSLEYALP